MRRFSINVFAAILVLAVVAVSQTPPPMPKPAPEHKNMDFLAGTWKMEGEAKPGPMGPGGKFTGTSKNEWLDGGFFMVMNSDFNVPGVGEAKGLAIMGYDPEKKKYTYNEFNSMGESVVSTGVRENGTWTWDNQQKMGDKVIRMLYVMKELSPTSYTFRMDMGSVGEPLTNVMEGKATKQ